MWNDDDDRIMQISASLGNNEETFPKKCPICGCKEAHVFFFKNNESKMGSLWEWCSNCKKYSHSRFLVPDWWENMNAIDSEKLEGNPDYLDAHKNEIDDWVNELVNEK